MRFCAKILLLCTAMFATFTAKAQIYSNDFENRQEWNAPWFNLHIVADSSATEENYVSICDTTHEYSLGFEINAGKDFPNQNVSLIYDFLFKADANTQADIVVSIDDTIRNRYWAAYPLADYVNDTAEWSQVQLNLIFPACYTQDSEIKAYVWNKGQEYLVFDDAQLEVKTDILPSYQPVIKRSTSSSTEQDSLYYELQYLDYWYDLKPVVEYINADGDTVNDPTIAEIDIQQDIIWDKSYKLKDRWDYQPRLGRKITTKTRFKEDIKLIRLAFVLFLPEKGEITVYRRNQHIDSLNLQSTYYLDREGFTIRHTKNSKLGFTIFHNTRISSRRIRLIRKN